jgi:hypothetical protein
MEQRFHCFAEWNGTRQKPVLTSLMKINPPFMTTEAVDMNGRIQMQGGKNWILPK